MNERPSDLQVKGVTASYGRSRVLHDVSFDVSEGELLAVLGPSGCGKTTLLRVIAGLHRAEDGLVSLGSRVVADGNGRHIAPERRHVGLVPQEGALFPHLSVAGNIAYGLGNSRMRSLDLKARASRREQVTALLDLVGLPGAGKARPAQLSGGQQQRVALARALAPSPALVLLDEPFSALDAGLRASLRADVRTLLYERKMTSILVTHDQDEALGMADRVAVLLDGRIAQIGTPEDVYHNPVSLEVGRFVGDSVVLDADPSAAPSGWVRTPIGFIPVLGTPSGRGKVLIRPEQVVFSHAAEPTGLTVTNVRFTGPSTLVTAATEDRKIWVRAHCAGDRQFTHGEEVSVDVTSSVPFFAD
ncbi:ABC transporter ATP-binding protein [Hoyosella subflava]|uniref:ABC-type quaternary amine transporter n=1 Tax=Hoyosella subflava (strain DSM 45089 / JCM 17490 / NBRC 109087 / DQS3-9A1) TaxID=443218 RepID=F6EGQ0_HOYSD|nr:ABC transporter ATP-binding protein [Hoyosella subflava]AEF42288.1 ABC transporter-like protein protein [Hoyosella subflava DQS3-9A1]